MKALNTVVKVLTALAAIAGVVYIVATYGEQIVAWAKKVLASLPKCPACEETVDAEAVEVVEEAEAEAPAAEEAPAEEAAEEASPAEEAPAEEPAPEIVVAENEPVAEDTDFAE